MLHLDRAGVGKSKVWDSIVEQDVKTCNNPLLFQLAMTAASCDLEQV